jgi:hypothetical protein
MQIYEMHMACTRNRNSKKCTRNRSLRVLLGLLTVPDWVKYDRLFQTFPTIKGRVFFRGYLYVIVVRSGLRAI